MPKRADLRTILIIGSGPIRIGQACEFDYSGSQACRVLRAEGLRVVLVNSNPATIMTDPEWADATYIEPLDAEALAQVIEKERPDALLPTLGGQTALNLAIELSDEGVLSQYEVELVGANVGAIRRAEDRLAFRQAMDEASLPVPRSVVVTSLDELPAGTPCPAVVRPAFTLGGKGGGLARDWDELIARIRYGLEASPIGQVLVEESVEGWQEYELEIMSDTAGNCVVVCSIENLDPMGVHTGDSWTVAPQQTLPDHEYQRLRDAAFAAARTVGVATGGANVQFAYEPGPGRLVLIEMNPRVSRSSALASKATGFPIAKLAALLAVGYTLDELPNDITGKSSAAFEPALDYVAVKAPRFDFEKFPLADAELGTEMRAVGEALGLGRTFPEALLKAAEGREGDGELPEIAGLHPYFVRELESIREAESRLAADGDVGEAKRFGIPDARIARVLGLSEADVRTRRLVPGRLAVDSCAAEFEARTPYFYLSHEAGDPVEEANGRTIVILGSGPNRIGQGIEFDYCCVHAAEAFRRLGYEAVMLNSNPETVSTDYDTSDRLYLEPVTLERALDVCAIEDPLGVVVSLGGQTPLTIARALADGGVPLLGDPLGAIESAEDRGAFGKILDELGIAAPRWGVADTRAEALAVAEEIGYPVLVRPHFVLGGRRMRVVRGPAELEVHGPSLVDQFLEEALELDVDLLCDGETAWVAGILEHIEPVGVHSGDSACVIPGPSVTGEVESRIGELAEALSRRLAARGLVNLQLALRDRELYVIEANPRASRTVPFVAKATGIPLVHHACRLMLGERLADLDLPVRAEPTRVWVKEAIFPDDRFPGAADRGAEMKSTGEVMAGGTTPAEAYARALRAAGRSGAPDWIGSSLQELATPEHHAERVAGSGTGRRARVRSVAPPIRPHLRDV
ncbi:MAG: carbamoyl-phosphate synthase large subunit [Actinomycetia bacterium]|nr:carbamoyl-phosphate synthase large subunit [Actinomycetes bacterium]